MRNWDKNKKGFNKTKNTGEGHVHRFPLAKGKLSAGYIDQCVKVQLSGRIAELLFLELRVAKLVVSPTTSEKGPSKLGVD